MNNLIEAKEIVEQLAGMYQPAQSLLSDSLFLELLSEEISEHRKVRHQYPAKVAFDIDESGLPVYCGIFEAMPKEFRGMVVVLNPDVIETSVADLLKEQSETIKRLQEGVKSTEERSSLIEKLEEFSKQIQKLGGDISNTINQASLIESLKNQIVVPQSSIDKTIAEKKNKLLDKILAG